MALKTIAGVSSFFFDSGEALPLPWRKLLKKDQITVARAAAMFDPTLTTKWKRETAAEEADRQIHLFKDRYWSRWFRQFAT